MLILALLSCASIVQSDSISSNIIADPTKLVNPSDPKSLKVTYNLFTRETRTAKQVFYHKSSDEEILKSSFNSDRKTKFIIHGYMSGHEDDNWMDKMKDYLLNKSDSNVFVIDWSKGASSVNYYQSAADTRVVGAMVANFIQKLGNLTGASPKTMHCIGHSLGAHTCGSVGEGLRSPKLAQISGLDPAGPGFNSLYSKTSNRLDRGDATLVTVIHTKAGLLTTEGIGSIPLELTGFIGNSDYLGHYDFWPNGGARQPGCSLTDRLKVSTLKGLSEIGDVAICNHNRGHDYPISERNECQFIGYDCDSYLHFQKGKCADCGNDGSKCKPMDFQLDYWDEFDATETPLPTLPTNYYLKTNEEEPFCLFHYQILVKISNNSRSTALGRMEVIVDDIHIAIEKNADEYSVGSNLGFSAGYNYTTLYTSGEQLPAIDKMGLKWSSLKFDDIKIDKVLINFMSHYKKSVRDEKSKEFCPTDNNPIRNWQTMIFKLC